MGLSPSAQLIWGIPVVAYDEAEETWDYENNCYAATPFWDLEREDWREFEGELEVVPFGHYEDPDNQRGILTSTRIKRYRGDCWDPTQIPVIDLATELAYSKSNDQARAAGLDVNFYADAGWWLVASYG